MRKQLGVVIVAVLALTAPRAWADDEAAKKILKDGILGAGVGAVSAGASGGKAGKGALIGAGTNVVGGAVIDLLTGSGQPKEPAYPQPAPTYPQPTYPAQTTYPGSVPAPTAGDYQTGYQKGYQEGFNQGFQQGLQQGRSGQQ